MGNLFELAEKQLIKEGKRYALLDVIDKAIVIRKFLDDKDKFLRQRRNRRYYLKKTRN